MKLKTEDWVLIAAIAAAAFILTRPRATAAVQPKQRTGTVTAGAMSFGNGLSSYQTGAQLLNAWLPRPTREIGWNDE